MAADIEDVNAMIKYANMLEKGQGVPMNKNEARNYYRISTNKNNIKKSIDYQSVHFLNYVTRAKYCDNNNNNNDDSLSSLEDPSCNSIAGNQMDREINSTNF